MTTALLLVVGSFAWTLRDRAARQFLLEQQVTRALVESKDSYERDRMPEALATMNRAEGLLASAGGGTKLLRDRVRRWRSDLDMAVRFEEIRLNRAAVRDESFDAAGAILAYREAFCDYGLDIDQLQVQEAAERIRASAVKAHLIAALDDWLPSVATTDPTWNRLLTIARLADSDPWRNRFRAAREEALHRRDISPVVKLARDKEVLNQSAITLQLLGQVLRANGENSLAVNVLRQSQQRRPDDFWINHTLAQALERMKPPQTDEAIAFFRVAVALRPESPGAILNLGRALAQQGKMDEAIAAYRRAIDLKPDYATPYNHLGAAFMDQNKFDEAAAAHRKAISLRPDLAAGHLHLGCVLQRQGKLDEAISELRRAIELQPDSAAAYNHLGLALSEDGKLDEGISALRKAAELQPDSETYNGLGAALAVQGKLDEAIAALRKAIELKPDDDRPYQTLGMVLTAQGRSDEAIAAFRKVIELKPDHALGYNGLGTMLQDQGKLDEAAAALRKAIELRPQYAEAYNNLGVVLSGQGKPDEAIAAYRKAIELQPDAAAAYSNLAIKLRDQGKWDEALELATKAVSLQPQNSMNWHALGWACYRTGDWQASIEAMEKSCKLHVNGIGDASQWLCLAMAHWQLGRHDEARTWYDKAVQNESAWPDVLRRLRTEAEELFGEKDENKSSKAQ
jgi:tetratricopeptide (TPR) repeat protein